MKKDNKFKLANIIWNHWQNGTLIDNITDIDDIAPKDRTDGYKVQSILMNFQTKTFLVGRLLQVIKLVRNI